MPEPSASDPFAALGDPTRRAILELLVAGDRSVEELAANLPVSRPAVSKHLRLLKEAGLVNSEPQGARRIYRLDRAGFDEAQSYFTKVWGEAAARFKIAAENTKPERSRRR